MLTDFKAYVEKLNARFITNKTVSPLEILHDLKRALPEEVGGLEETPQETQKLDDNLVMLVLLQAIVERLKLLPAGTHSETMCRQAGEVFLAFKAGLTNLAIPAKDHSPSRADAGHAKNESRSKAVGAGSTLRMNAMSSESLGETRPKQNNKDIERLGGVSKKLQVRCNTNSSYEGSGYQVREYALRPEGTEA